MGIWTPPDPPGMFDPGNDPPEWDSCPACDAELDQDDWCDECDECADDAWRRYTESVAEDAAIDRHQAALEDRAERHWASL